MSSLRLFKGFLRAVPLSDHSRQRITSPRLEPILLFITGSVSIPPSVGKKWHAIRLLPFRWCAT